MARTANTNNLRPTCLTTYLPACLPHDSNKLAFKTRKETVSTKHGVPQRGPRGDLTAQASPARVGHVKRRQAGLNRETQAREETHTAGGAWVMCYDWLAA